MKTFTVMTVLVILLAFYWFEYRPSQIRNHCQSVAEKAAVEAYKEFAETLSETVSEIDVPLFAKETMEKNINSGNYNVENYNHYYSVCLQANGIAK